MAPATPPDALERLSAMIVARFPELAGASFTLAPRGWDSIAVEVDGRLVFKFPRHAAAQGRLETEARLLGAIRPRVMLAVPDMTLFTEPQVFSRHEKLLGEHLTPELYAAMSEAGKACVGHQLARFYAELHTLDDSAMAAVGAGPIGPWLAPEAIGRLALPVLPEDLRPRAGEALVAFAALPPDPLGTTYGFFDGHGWNMAFDAAAERLNGVYDFGDSGFGELHQEFIYSSLTSFDLTRRIVAGYEAATGRPLDRERIRLLTAIHGLSELAEAVDDAANVAAGGARFRRWADATPG
ncbi:MAG TPA: aminoglycoside phosphotransferase family protein [Caulobacteraceae bacterium]|nr:aminoglycoside phosphotransferase family protein [Caulobacteraceae bacterium]